MCWIGKGNHAPVKSSSVSRSRGRVQEANRGVSRCPSNIEEFLIFFYWCFPSCPDIWKANFCALCKSIILSSEDQLPSELCFCSSEIYIAFRDWVICIVRNLISCISCVTPSRRNSSGFITEKASSVWTFEICGRSTGFPQHPNLSQILLR